VKLTLKLDDCEHWIEIKSTWLRGDMKKWEAAKGEKESLLMLAIWCPRIHVFDVDGKLYEAIADLTEEALDNLDVAVLRFLFGAPVTAYMERGRLGNAVGGLLSATQKG
jgi:hypothetical protein